MGVAGHGFGTFVDPTLPFGILAISGPFLAKWDQNFESVFEVDLGGLEVAGHDFGSFFEPTLLLDLCDLCDQN